MRSDLAGASQSLSRGLVCSGAHSNALQSTSISSCGRLALRDPLFPSRSHCRTAPILVASMSAPHNTINESTDSKICPICELPFKTRGFAQHFRACQRRQTQAAEDERLQEQLREAEQQGFIFSYVLQTSNAETNSL